MAPGPEEVSEPAASAQETAMYKSEMHGHDDLTDPPIASDRPAWIDQFGRPGV